MYVTFFSSFYFDIECRVYFPFSVARRRVSFPFDSLNYCGHIPISSIQKHSSEIEDDMFTVLKFIYPRNWIPLNLFSYFSQRKNEVKPNGKLSDVKTNIFLALRKMNFHLFFVCFVYVLSSHFIYRYENENIIWTQ